MNRCNSVLQRDSLSFIAHPRNGQMRENGLPVVSGLNTKGRGLDVPCLYLRLGSVDESDYRLHKSR